jgi:predicted nucleotidyltransferase
MDLQALLQPQHQLVMQRFVAACQADARIVSAFLGGSYASGTADAYSDLDLGLITTDTAYDNFVAQRESFMRLLGDLVFLEDFDLPNIVFFILQDGTEGELALGREGQFLHMHSGPYRILVDKTGILANIVFAGNEPSPAEQREMARRLVFWFWHDLSHFTTAVARGQLWWANGQLEDLRRVCVNLARLKQNAAHRADGYEKVEQALPMEQLSPLQASFVPLEPGAMLQAALVIVRFYEELASVVAGIHGIAYPSDLARVTYARLKKLM